jgi:hypothetical protein
VARVVPTTYTCELSSSSQTSKKFAISYETSMAHKILEFDVKTAQSLIRAEMDINHSRAHHHSPLTLTTSGRMVQSPKRPCHSFSPSGDKVRMKAWPPEIPPYTSPSLLLLLAEGLPWWLPPICTLTPIGNGSYNSHSTLSLVAIQLVTSFTSHCPTFPHREVRQGSEWTNSRYNFSKWV